MPTGPKGEKRPADVIGNAVKVMRIATGEETETVPPGDGKDDARSHAQPDFPAPDRPQLLGRRARVVLAA
jgi:hypothetical protein